MQNEEIGKKSHPSTWRIAPSAMRKKVKITSIFVVILLLATSASFASSPATTGAKWLFTGASFNYTLNTESNINNSSHSSNYFISLESIEILSIGNQTFNASYSVEYLLPQRNGSGTSVISTSLNVSPITDYVQKSLEYSTPLWVAVDSSTLRSLSAHAVLYLNYLNASSPLNISSVSYNYNSTDIPAYKVWAFETHPGAENSAFDINVTIYIDAYSGVVLYYQENNTYPNSLYTNGSQERNSTNVPLIGHSSSSLKTSVFLFIALVAIVAISIIVYRMRAKKT